MKEGLIKENILDWIENKIKLHNKETEFDNGYAIALEELRVDIGYGKFNETVYVKLKDKYSLADFNHNEEYEASSILGGEYFEVLNNVTFDIEVYPRHMFEVVRVYNIYTKETFKIE